MIKLIPFIIVIIIIAHTTVMAQPYLDIANANCVISPGGKLNGARAEKYSLLYTNAVLNIPFQSKKSGDIFLTSPFYEQWQTVFTQNLKAGARYTSFALPLTYIHPFSQKWRALYSITPRLNYANSNAKNILQLGGAVLVTRQLNTNLSVKAGLFYNSEFFGVFFIPLVGIDWTINDKNKLFGVLPNSITYEHKCRSNFYYGAVFHAITNSYRVAKDAYVRIDDNRVGVFADTYVAKNVVLSIESGYSILRKMQQGQKNLPTVNFGLKDNYYCKLTLSLRLRLNGAVKK